MFTEEKTHPLTALFFTVLLVVAVLIGSATSVRSAGGNGHSTTASNELAIPGRS